MHIVQIQVMRSEKCISVRLPLKKGTGNQTIKTKNGERGTGNGESLKAGIFKSGNL